MPYGPSISSQCLGDLNFVFLLLLFCFFVFLWVFFFFFKHLKLGHGTGFQLPVEVSSLMEDVSSP